MTILKYNQDREYVLSLVRPFALLIPPKHMHYCHTPRKDWMYDLTLHVNDRKEIEIWRNYLSQQGLIVDPEIYATCVAIPVGGDAYLTNEDIWEGDSMIPVPQEHL